MMEGDKEFISLGTHDKADIKLYIAHGLYWRNLWLIAQGWAFHPAVVNKGINLGNISP